MNKGIRSLYIRLPTPKQIGEFVNETYLGNQDASKAYHLYREVISTQQNCGSYYIFWEIVEVMT